MDIKKIDKSEDLNILHTKCKEIKEITVVEKNEIESMKKALKKDDGLGLAANQVGIDKRIVLIFKDIKREKGIIRKNGKEIMKTKFDQSEIIVMINPIFKPLSNKITQEVESCLSVPLTSEECEKEEENNLVVERYKDIEVTYLDENLQLKTLEAHDLCARIIQHEVDHLNGSLYIDYNLEEYKNKVLPETMVQAINTYETEKARLLLNNLTEAKDDILLQNGKNNIQK